MRLLARPPSILLILITQSTKRLINTTKMPSINVSLKDGASKDQLEAAKKQVTDQGGKITHEFKLVKGFTYAPHLLQAYVAGF